MEDVNAQMRQFADNMAKYVKKTVVDPAMEGAVRFFRAKVVAGPSGGKIQVQKPFDSTVMNLPYASSVRNLTTDDECIVLVLGSYSNCVVVGDGMLSNL